jgi:hypothetical protein
MLLARHDVAVAFHRTIAIFDLKIIEQIGNCPRRFDRASFTVELNFHLWRFPGQFWLVCSESRTVNCIGTARDVNPLEGMFPVRVQASIGKTERRRLKPELQRGSEVVLTGKPGKRYISPRRE